VQWWQMAADQGLAGDQYNLGACYAHGRGVTQSDKEANRWAKKAADQGHKHTESALDSLAR
jgi:TPR repeat protein